MNRKELTECQLSSYWEEIKSIFTEYNQVFDLNLALIFKNFYLKQGSYLEEYNMKEILLDVYIDSKMNKYGFLRRIIYLTTPGHKTKRDSSPEPLRNESRYSIVNGIFYVNEGWRNMEIDLTPPEKIVPEDTSVMAKLYYQTIDKLCNGDYLIGCVDFEVPKDQLNGLLEELATSDEEDKWVHVVGYIPDVDSVIDQINNVVDNKWADYIIDTKSYGELVPEEKRGEITRETWDNMSREEKKEVAFGYYFSNLDYSLWKCTKVELAED